MSYIAWQLTDENGMEVFKQCLGCGDPGVQTLIRSGKYTYTFTAPPRQKVHFRVLEQGTGMAYINWRLTDENGMELFSKCLGCGDPGVVMMVNGGTYTLTVGNRRIPATGAYAVEYMPQ